MKRFTLLHKFDVKQEDYMDNISFWCWQSIILYFMYLLRLNEQETVITERNIY